MKIAIVSDIHGNLNAFNKFVDKIKSEDIEIILNLGDFVRGRYPHEIMEIIMSDDRFISIKGNHEYGYCKEHENDENSDVKKYLQWINTQEDSRTVEIQGVKILMIHSRMNSNNAPPLLYKSGTFNEFMDDYPDDVDLICFGHTHIQLFIENFYGKKILNPGSIGAAIDKKTNFAIVNIENDGISYKFYKEDYDR